MRLQRWLAPQSNGQNITVLYTSINGVYSGCGENRCLSMCMYFEGHCHACPFLKKDCLCQFILERVLVGDFEFLVTVLHWSSPVSCEN
jgi:hypothetical protein